MPGFFMPDFYTRSSQGGFVSAQPRAVLNVYCLDGLNALDL